MLRNKPINLSDLPNDILQTITEDFIGVHSRTAMLLTSKEIREKADDPRSMLKVLYPETYDQTQKKIKHEEKITTQHFHQLFKKTYDKEEKNERYGRGIYWDYPERFEHPQRLSVLFKTGDLPALKKANISLDNLWLINYPLLYGSYRNGHKKILDYYYSEFKNKIHKFGLNQLHLAIFCFQDKETLTKTLASIRDINEPAQAFGPLDLFGPGPSEHLTPLMLAAKINNQVAVEFLCEQPKITINLMQQKPLSTALDHALMQDNLSIAKYLRQHGATFFPERYFNNSFIYEKDVSEHVGQDSVKYLYEIPDIVVAAMKQKYNNTCASRFLKSADDFHREKITAWCQTYKENKNDVFYPLIHYYNNQNLGDGNWERGVFTLGYLLKEATPEKVVALMHAIINEIPDGNVVEGFKDAIKQVKINIESKDLIAKKGLKLG